MVKSDNAPKLNAQITPKTQAIIVFKIVAFLLDILFSSTKKAIDISLIDIVEVSDAKNRRKKNKADHTTPPGRWWNMEGSTSKTRAGPAVGLILNVKTAGKIIIPANNATVVSNEAVIVALLARRVLRLK